MYRGQEQSCFVQNAEKDTKGRFQIIAALLPFLLEIYNQLCVHRTSSIMKDPDHPSHCLFSLMPSGNSSAECWKAFTIKPSQSSTQCTFVYCAISAYFNVICYSYVISYIIFQGIYIYIFILFSLHCCGLRWTAFFFLNIYNYTRRWKNKVRGKRILCHFSIAILTFTCFHSAKLYNTQRHNYYFADNTQMSLALSPSN